MILQNAELAVALGERDLGGAPEREVVGTLLLLLQRRGARFLVGRHADLRGPVANPVAVGGELGLGIAEARWRRRRDHGGLRNPFRAGTEYRQCGTEQPGPETPFHEPIIGRSLRRNKVRREVITPYHNRVYAAGCAGEATLLLRACKRV